MAGSDSIGSAAGELALADDTSVVEGTGHGPSDAVETGSAVVQCGSVKNTESPARLLVMSGTHLRFERSAALSTTIVVPGA